MNTNRNIGLIALALILSLSCKSNKNGPTPQQTMEATAEKLVKLYRNGEVNECLYKSKKVFHCALNAYDAGSEIFNIQGDKIADCYYNNNDEIPRMCEEIEGCNTLYRTAKNIWRRPGVTWVGMHAVASDSAKK